MNPEERAVIRENLPKLISETGDLSNLKAQVVSRELLSSSEVQAIFNSAPVDTESQLYRFYDTVPRKGSDAFVKLVESLTETSNVHVGNFLRSSLDRKRSSLVSSMSIISSGSDDVFEECSRPKRCRLESIKSQDLLDESDVDDEDCTASYSQDCRIENGKMNSKTFLKLLLQSQFSTSVTLKEMSICGRIAEKVHLPKLRDYIWQNSKLDEYEEIDTGILLFFYKSAKFNSFQFTDICCTGVNIEINFAGEFVIISDERSSCVKVGGNRLLDEIGIGGIRKIFGSIKSNSCFPKRVELFDVHITRCPFPIDTSFLIQQLSMKDVSFNKSEILQKTIEVCPELTTLEMLCTTEMRQKIELHILQTGIRKNMIIILNNFDIELSNYYDNLSIRTLELNSCRVPENLFLIDRQFNSLETIIINNCTSPEGDNILSNQTFLGSLLNLANLKSISLQNVTQCTTDFLENNYSLKLPFISNVINLLKNQSGQFISC